MKHSRGFLLAVLLLSSSASASTAFTYQGRLDSSGQPYSGTVGIVIEMFDALTGGNKVGDTLARSVIVADGLFQLDLDFGSSINEEPRFLEITVNGQLLSPRQSVRAAPLATFSLRSGDGISTLATNATLSGAGTNISPLGVALNSLNRTHILDAAGLRSATGVGDPSALTSETNPLVSVTLNIPTSGYVSVIGTVNVLLDHTSGQVQNALLAVATTPSGQASGATRVVRLPPGAAEGTHIIPVTSQAVFPVSAGSHTFYLNGRDFFGTSATGGISVTSPRITAIYVPSQY